MSGIQSSETFGAVAKALAAAQAHFGEVKRTRTAHVRPRDKPAYTYTYATLADVWDVIRRPLAEAGLAIVQGSELDGAMMRVTTKLLHESGEWLANTVDLATGGTSAQTIGSALTYGRRYGVSSLLGIVTDDDDDGSAAESGAQAQGPARGPARGDDRARSAPVTTPPRAATTSNPPGEPTPEQKLGALCVSLAKDGHRDQVEEVLKRHSRMKVAKISTIPTEKLAACWKDLQALRRGDGANGVPR